MHDETIAIHGGYTPDGTRAVAVPIYQTVAHDFIDAAHAGAVLDLETPGFHYNRLNNPTLDVLEQRICALEGGTAALVVASGMAAVSYAILTVASAGSNFVVAPQLYGATFTYFAHVLPTLGIEARFAVDDRAESIAPLIDENTRAVFCETIGNPAGNIVDLEAVAAVAHAAGVPLIVDNTVATPLMLKPFEHGADVVVHSLTKFVGGHGTTLGGAIVDGGRFPWADHPDRFPMFNQPEPAFHGVVFARDFPERPFTVRARSTQLRNSGATLSPFNAFLLLQGLETDRLRRGFCGGRTRPEDTALALRRRICAVRHVEPYCNPAAPCRVSSPALRLAFRHGLTHLAKLENFGALPPVIVPEWCIVQRRIRALRTRPRDVLIIRIVGSTAKRACSPCTRRITSTDAPSPLTAPGVPRPVGGRPREHLTRSPGVELLRLSRPQSVYRTDLLHNDFRLRPAVPAEHVDQFRPQMLEVA